MLRRKFFMAVAAAAVAGLLGPASARAGFTFTVSDGTVAGTFTGLNQGDVVNLDGFRITVNGDENSPGTTSGTSGFVTNQSTVKIDALTSSTSAVTFTITSEATGFTVAPSPYTVTSALAASSLIGTLEGLSTLNGSVIAGSFTTINSVTQTDQSTVDGLVAATPFSLGNQVKVILPATNNAGNSTAAAYTFTTTVTAAPAPATAILALAGAPIFGAFGWMRRRKAVVA